MPRGIPLTKKDVVLELEQYDYKLIKTYLKKNLRVVVIEDNYGYKYETLLTEIKKGKVPDMVNTRNPYSLHNISCWIKNNKREFKILKDNTYVGNKDKLKCKCNICKENFLISWLHIRRFHGCSNCLIRMGEKRIKDFLTDKSIEFIPQKTFPDCKDISLLKFDFYLPKYNLCIEYNGEQHYFPMRNNWFGGEEGFEKNKRRDKIKVKYCKKNKIDLLIIPYWEFENIEKILNTKFKEN